MKMQCPICLVVEGKIASWKIYEDDKILAMLHDTPASIGHIIIVPKKHYNIIEQVPDYIVSHMMIVANKLSTAVFEGLNAHGTNIIINNGPDAQQTMPHFSVHIIPRRENDGLNFNWMPKQLTEEEISTVEIQLKEQTQKVGNFETEEKAPLEEKGPARVIDEENYMTKQLNRIP